MGMAVPRTGPDIASARPPLYHHHASTTDAPVPQRRGADTGF